MQCPCGSKNSFSQCCYLLINQETTAQSPEQLMRSRYSAYATKASAYIYNTYANASQVEQSESDIDTWAKQTNWLKLVIHCASEFSVFAKSLNNTVHNNYPTVCFSAYYQHQGSYFRMKETSRFSLENDQWRYLDGEVSESEELETPKRNDLCFCSSQKKFKRCCGNK